MRNPSNLYSTAHLPFRSQISCGVLALSARAISIGVPTSGPYVLCVLFVLYVLIVFATSPKSALTLYIFSISFLLLLSPASIQLKLSSTVISENPVRNFPKIIFTTYLALTASNSLNNFLISSCFLSWLPVPLSLAIESSLSCTSSTDKLPFPVFSSWATNPISPFCLNSFSASGPKALTIILSATPVSGELYAGPNLPADRYAINLASSGLASPKSLAKITVISFLLAVPSSFCKYFASSPNFMLLS
ncbi:MAG: hypothetical protein UY11_C0035G0014 [Candidatus Amesbacteria bacterium GW2011_GWC2_47_8]|uniref:Uncharacterized protein n=1 Tax=Candidatus Amesbacteria bacterium GW2011_GWC2_47_8 TaxID=1618367 RepID=A0A0G1VXQ6_9BACT|nr:MAG: hypothetical protein UY11_C0035G0014 [Candidatus Amesbacteria bacterium GW2011_GWC2_47_8]